MTVAAARLWKYITTSPKWHYPSPQVTACLLSFNAITMMGTPGKKKKSQSCHGKKSYDQSRQCIKKQRHHFASKGQYSQSDGFSNSHVRMWELNHKENWAPKNWCFQTVVLEKTLESPLDCKEIKPVNPKGNQPWIFTGSTDAEAEAPIVWPPNTKSQLTRKDPDPEKDEGQEEKAATEDEMVGWHHWLNGHEFEWIQGDSEGQGSLHAAVRGVTKSRIQLSDWTTMISITPLDFSYTLLTCLGCGMTMQCLAQPLSSTSAFWITCLQTCSLVCSLPFGNLERPPADQYYFHMSVVRFVWLTHCIMSSPPPSVMKVPL